MDLSFEQAYIPSLHTRISELRLHSEHDRAFEPGGMAAAEAIAVLKAAFPEDDLRDIYTPIPRGTEFRNLKMVLSSGVDRDPPSEGFWAADIGKALEYGGWPKLLLGFDPARVERSWAEAELAATSEDDVNALKKAFPYQLSSHDGARIWFSHISIPTPGSVVSLDSHLQYERDFGWRLRSPGLDALRFLMLIYRMKVDDAAWHSARTLLSPDSIVGEGESAPHN